MIVGMTPTIRLVSATPARGTDDDEPLLVAALDRAGARVEVVVWDDPEVDWSAAEVTVIRSTWDYTMRVERFLAWARRIESLTTLVNPAEVLAWNSDKTYLSELISAGAPVVPSTFLHPGDEVVLPESGEFVVKPTISSGARYTARYRAAERDRARAHALDLLEAGRTVMVQPYQSGVDEHGETALLFFGGRFSHAANKEALLEVGRPAMADKLFALEKMAPATPSPAERDVAEQVLAAMPFDRANLLYARVDVVPGPDGPQLLELELVEPSLFLPQAPSHRVDELAGRILELSRGNVCE